MKSSFGEYSTSMIRNARDRTNSCASLRERGAMRSAFSIIAPRTRKFGTIQKRPFRRSKSAAAEPGRSAVCRVRLKPDPRDHRVAGSGDAHDIVVPQWHDADPLAQRLAEGARRDQEVDTR